jgi:hypothetical protein
MTEQQEKRDRNPFRHRFKLSEIVPTFKHGAWKVMLPVWIVIGIFFWLGINHGWDIKITTAGAILLGILSNALFWLLAVIGAIPLIGPLVVKALALPLIWLLNALGYLVSFRAIRRGYSRDVITYRSITIALLVGIVIGFVIGNLT